MSIRILDSGLRRLVWFDEANTAPILLCDRRFQKCALRTPAFTLEVASHRTNIRFVGSIAAQLSPPVDERHAMRIEKPLFGRARGTSGRTRATSLCTSLRTSSLGKESAVVARARGSPTRDVQPVERRPRPLSAAHGFGPCPAVRQDICAVIQYVPRVAPDPSTKKPGICPGRELARGGAKFER